MKKVVIGIVLLVVFIILVFQIVGNSAGDLINAADSVSDANNCSSHVTPAGVEGRYNFSDKSCYNGTAAGNALLYVAGQIDLPLNTLFGRGGVLLLIFMAVVLIIAILTVIKGVKQKK